MFPYEHAPAQAPESALSKLLVAPLVGRSATPYCAAPASWTAKQGLHAMTIVGHASMQRTSASRSSDAPHAQRRVAPRSSRCTPWQLRRRVRGNDVRRDRAARQSALGRTPIDQARREGRHLRGAPGSCRILQGTARSAPCKIRQDPGAPAEEPTTPVMSDECALSCEIAPYVVPPDAATSCAGVHREKLRAMCNCNALVLQLACPTMNSPPLTAQYGVADLFHIRLASALRRRCSYGKAVYSPSLGHDDVIFGALTVTSLHLWCCKARPAIALPRIRQRRSLTPPSAARTQADETFGYVKVTADEYGPACGLVAAGRLGFR